MNAPRDCELKLRMSEEDYQFLLSASTKLGIKPATPAYMFMKELRQELINRTIEKGAAQ